MTWQVAESWRQQAGQMSGERCGPPWGCLVTQEERQGVGLAPWPLGPEVRPSLVRSFPLGGGQESGLWTEPGGQQTPPPPGTQESLE